MTCRPLCEAEVVGPRHLHRIAGPTEWAESVRAGGIQPHNLGDAVAVAFTAAALDVIGDPEMLTLDAGEEGSGQKRSRQILIAASLGWGRERFCDTYQGNRWIRLPEITGALTDSVIGEPFATHLRHVLSTNPGVLDSDWKSRPGGRSGLGSAILAAIPERTKEERTVGELEVLEARVRSDVVTLDRLQHAAARRGEQLHTSHDWSAIRRFLDIPREPMPSGGAMTRRARASGTPHLAELVREVLLDASGPIRSYRIKQRVRARTSHEQDGHGRDGPLFTDDQIDRALARLATRGEARRVRYGLYQATSKMRGAT